MTSALKTALLSKLKTAATGAGNRVYATIAPQSATAPYIVFTQVSSVDEVTHDGYASLQRSRYQIACYAATAKAAQDLADQVISGLRDWTSVQACFKENVVDGYEADVDLFHVIVEFLMWHST